MLCCAVLCCAVLCCAVLCCAVLRCAALRCAVLQLAAATSMLSELLPFHGKAISKWHKSLPETHCCFDTLCLCHCFKAPLMLQLNGTSRIPVILASS